MFVDTYPDFSLRPAALARAVSRRTKMIVLNSPCNPTGKVATRAEVAAVVEIARKHDLVLLSDEIYDSFVYDDPVPSPFADYPCPSGKPA